MYQVDFQRHQRQGLEAFASQLDSACQGHPETETKPDMVSARKPLEMVWL
jgi:hypothetical protein